jgi:16S rRNA (cytosine967-C5)-methyltransferase
MTSPARAAAFGALTNVSAGRHTLAAALEFRRTRLREERDRALATAIVQGTLRWQRACDHLIGHAARRPVDALDLEVLVILRLSVFQLVYLHRVPAAAVVDDAVNLVKAARRRSAAGFVNAVLRSTARLRHRLPFPPRPADLSDRKAVVSYLGVTCSHPDWLVERWLDRAGFESTEAWVRFNNQPAPLTISVNRLRASRAEVRHALASQGVETRDTRFSPSGLVVEAGHLPRPGDETYLVQDEASQLVPLVLDARPGERVLDLCAAPGGKTVAIDADMQQKGQLVACDVRPRRLALLRRTLDRAGAYNVCPIRISETGALPFSATFDRVFVDAPCSGLGIVRRDPDLKWRRKEGDLQALGATALELLTRAAQVVGREGRLVYATCSSESEENEGVVNAFLARHAGFRLLDLRTSGRPELAELLDDHGALRTLPYAHGLDAFFAAAMERTER